jgi:hypothetical protein
MAAIWLAWLALRTVSVSQVAHSQVRLFLVAPTDRHSPIFDPRIERVCAILDTEAQIS